MKLRFAFTTAGLLAVVGCASLFGVDGYSDSTEELCELLERCYQVKDCRDRLGPRLDAASASERSDWLSAISDQACLEQCSAARRCLNIAPVCGAQASQCSSPQECCGFLNGVRSCGQDGTCCLAKGAACGPESQCCNNDCKNGFCGGAKCAEPGAPCLNPFECCTNICIAGKCSEGICIELGGGCEATEDCCEGKCLGGRCGYEECRAENEACTDGVQCCDGRPCVEIPASPGVKLCQGSKPCAPLDFPCQENTDCCVDGDQPLVCDPKAKRCGEACRALGISCSTPGECCSKVCESGICGCSNDACTGLGDCCGEAVCVGGVCETNCAPAVCHDECVPGGPLSPSCSKIGPPAVDGACVQKVCEKDGYCCCKAWDAACIQGALDLCPKTVCQ